jgi:hypothetical protein
MMPNRGGESVPKDEIIGPIYMSHNHSSVLSYKNRSLYNRETQREKDIVAELRQTRCNFDDRKPELIRESGDHRSG